MASKKRQSDTSAGNFIPPREAPKKSAPTSDWYDLLINGGYDKMEDIPPQFHGSARIGLSYLKEHKDEMIGLGESAFLELFSMLSTGARGKARDLFVRTKLGPDGLIALMETNNEQLHKATIESEKFSAQFNAFLSTVGDFGIRIIRTLLEGQLNKK